MTEPSATYDPIVRAHYILLRDEPVLATILVSESVMVDITYGGQVVGVEVLEHNPTD